MEHYKIKQQENGTWKIYERGLLKYYDIDTKDVSYPTLEMAVKTLHSLTNGVHIIIRSEPLKK